METNQVHNIYHLNSQKMFTEDQAYELVNLLIAVTGKSKIKINALNSRLEHYKNQPNVADEIQTELNLEIQKWSDKTRRLGAVPLALYKAKIPNDAGFFLWEFPSVELSFS
jgi:hypothetical protein